MKNQPCRHGNLTMKNSGINNNHDYLIHDHCSQAGLYPGSKAPQQVCNHNTKVVTGSIAYYTYRQA